MHRDIIITLKKNCLRRRPLAALRGFRIEVIIQILFTAISSKIQQNTLTTCYILFPAFYGARGS